jgi:hypothetical protein
MPLKDNRIGIPIQSVICRIGRIEVHFLPYHQRLTVARWNDYWTWQLFFDGERRGMEYRGLYLPGGITEETVAMLVGEVWLRDHHSPEIMNYWEGGEAC